MPFLCILIKSPCQKFQIAIFSQQTKNLKNGTSESYFFAEFYHIFKFELCRVKGKRGKWTLAIAYFSQKMANFQVKVVGF